MSIQPVGREIRVWISGDTYLALRHMADQDGHSISYYVRQLILKDLEEVDKDANAEKNRLMFNYWLSCHGQQETADAMGIPQQTISDSFTGFGDIADFGKIDNIDAENPTKEEEKILATWKRHIDKPGRAAAEHATDFEAPIYNVWKLQNKTNEVSHYGNSEVRWLDNLLYLYTNPFDVVVAPFTGGGSTIDICKKRFRRYFVSDRKPIVERENEIRKHDITEGLPSAPWKDTKLVYLDPPYWKQAENRYSKDDEGLANMSLEDFNKQLSGLIHGFARKLKNGEPRYIALIMQPTQWAADDKQYTDHVGDMLRAVKLPVDMRFSVPYESSQYNAQCVNYAKENKMCLVLTREIVVWRV